MSLRDDDEPTSTSSSSYFSRADHGHADQQERKAAAQGKLLQLKRAALAGQVGKQGLQALKTDVTDAAAQQAADALAQTKATFGPKTNDQEAKAAVQTAGQQADAEQLITESKRQDAAEQAAGPEQQQDVG
jgi:hypothetical protein